MQKYNRRVIRGYLYKYKYCKINPYNYPQCPKSLITLGKHFFKNILHFTQIAPQALNIGNARLEMDNARVHYSQEVRDVIYITQPTHC